jgi:hypothetical protein
MNDMDKSVIGTSDIGLQGKESPDIMSDTESYWTNFFYQYQISDIRGIGWFSCMDFREETRWPDQDSRKRRARAGQSQSGQVSQDRLPEHTVKSSNFVSEH